MKNRTDENMDSLFQKTKEIPIEIPLENLEKMILGFPSSPIPAMESHWFVKLFNLKYIAMTILPLIAILTLMLVPNQPETIPTITETEMRNASETLVASPEISVVTENPYSPIKESTIITATLPEKITSSKSHPDIRHSNTQAVDLKKPEIDSELKAFKEQEASDKITTSGYTTFLKPKLFSQDPSPLKNISTPRLKKLRRNLYKNLIDDGMLTSKSILVEIQLMANQILVNNQPIPASFLLKYKNLTNIAGTGPDRKIKMHPDYILAGDFTEAGFRGHGFGNFTVKMIEEDNLFFQSNDLRDKLLVGDTNFLEIENDALISFANEIQHKTPDDSGWKRLFAPNLNTKKMTYLHRDLTLLLTEDNFIDEEKEFAVIQLPKDIIRVNGENLSGEQFKKYQKIINSYRIKHGRDRMILLSPHFIKVGNYNYGNFSGTATTLPFKE